MSGKGLDASTCLHVKVNEQRAGAPLPVADQKQVEILKKGVAKWKAWRRSALSLPNLSGADLSGADLEGADLEGAHLMAADLSGANLRSANLSCANLNSANLSGANLSGANLSSANLRFTNLMDADLGAAHLRSADLSSAGLRSVNLSGADLSGAGLSRADLTAANLRSANLSSAYLMGANLSGANLSRADLSAANLSANLSGANLSEAKLIESVFGDVNLSSVIGLETCIHHGPSTIDHRTLEQSESLPLLFLRGVGLPDSLIEYLPSLLNQAIQHYSCFISYSTKDQEFAKRLHADLQNNGVRCWFAPHDLRIGDKILDNIDDAIRLRDKVLLILSEHSINSDWVEDEVTAGFEEERKRRQIVLFPVRLDETVMKTNEAWAAKLRARLIGDFRRWENHDAYKDSFERVLRDLTIKS